MNKLLCGVVAACLLAANNGSCLGGGVNSAGDSTPARICEAASRAGAAADVIVQGLLAANIAPDKVADLVPLIQRGRLMLTAGCAILIPAGDLQPDAPVVTGVS